MCAECMIKADLPTVVIEISCQYPNNKDSRWHAYEQNATVTLIKKIEKQTNEEG